LGIQPAAEALKLDFIPLFTERYDLVIPTQHYLSGKLAPLLKIIRGSTFAEAVARLPGHEAEGMGELLAELS
jgi:putative molybdopterin biosynthesis protein